MAAGLIAMLAMERADSSTSNIQQWSSYYKSTDVDAKKWYDAKVATQGSIGDLYCVEQKSFVNVEWQDWPPVEYPDMYNYLISTPSIHTKDKLKAYKSLEAYTYFVNGWVSIIAILVVPSGSADYLVMAHVKHSQKLSESSLHPWIARSKSASVRCAHCTCMTGLGEVCSHIAAILFLMEATLA